MTTGLSVLGIPGADVVARHERLVRQRSGRIALAVCPPVMRPGGNWRLVRQCSACGYLRTLPTCRFYFRLRLRHA